MEAAGATASIAGIASFGLGLAKSLQALIDSVIEAEETITLTVAEVNATASTLKRIQDFIDQDKAASEQEHRATVFNSTSIEEIRACALQCQKIYVQIIILIEKASMQAGDDESKDTVTQPPVADELSRPAVRLESFSKNVTKLGRKMRWPWLEPRIKRCKEHLERLKISLMLSLQVFLIAESHASAPVTRILGTDDENEIRDRAETLRKKMTEMRAKKGPPMQPNRQPPSSDNRASDQAGTSSNPNKASTASIISSSSSELHSDSPASSTYSSWISDPVRRPRRPRKLRESRALRAFRAFKSQIRKRTGRKSTFKQDSASIMFEAYLIYPVSGPFRENSSAPPVKLPFGHRRLTREVNRALRKFNPWDILLVLSPQDRVLVDRVVQHVQLAATGTTDVCLVAIDIDEYVDVDGYSHANISGLEAGDLVWNRMVLFFRHEPAHTRKGSTEAERDVIEGRLGVRATVRNIFLGSRRRSKKLLELLERADQQRREDDRIAKEEAEEGRREEDLRHRVEAEVARREAMTRDRQEHERRSRERRLARDEVIADEARLKLLETQRQQEEDEGRKREEREALGREIKNAIRLQMIAPPKQEREGQAVKDADAGSEDVEKGIDEGELKMPEAERARKILEDEPAKIKAKEGKAKGEKAKLPVTFKDALGRKFSFPFYLVQTWEGMENLIKQAFHHVEVIGPQVQEGHYDLMDSEAQVILPSLWSDTIKPGETVSMRMWPENEYPLLDPQHMSSQQRLHFEMAKRRYTAAPQPQGGYLGAAHRGGLDQHMTPSPGFAEGSPPRLSRILSDAGHPPLPGMRQFPPTDGEGEWPAMVDSVEVGRPKTKRRAKRDLGFVSGYRPGKKGGEDKNKHPKLNVVESRVEDSKETGKGENAEDIDKELGLNDPEGAEQMAVKDIDELLELWTNSAGNEEEEQTLLNSLNPKAQ